MKSLSSAMLAVLLVVSGQSIAEQTAQPGTQNNRDAMVMPSAHDQSPFDFNHMGAGRIRRTVLQRTQPVIRFCPATAGLFLSPYLRRFAQPKTKHVDVQTRHNQHRAKKL